MEKIGSNILIITVVITFIYSCTAGVGDTVKELSGGYTLRSDGNMSYILPNTTMFDLGVDSKVIEVKYNDNFILIKQKPDFESYKNFLAFNLRSNYSTLATIDSTDKNLLPGQYEFYKQKLIEDSSLYKMLSTKISTENTAKDIQISLEIADSIIKNDRYYQKIFSREINYWIIAHREPQQYFYVPSSIVLGPFSKEEYLKKRRELKVSKELKLDFE